MDSKSDYLKIYNGQVITPDSVIKNGTVIIKDGLIQAIAEGDLIVPGAVEMDAGGKYIGPGLIDIQINGFMGVDFSDQDLTLNEIRKAIKALWKVGVTTILPTVITNAQQNLKKSFSILSTALDDDEIGLSIPGFHLEGPYISPVQGYRGAHLEKYIRQPQWKEFSELQDAAKNRIMMVTLAPEIDGAIDFIRKCKESGMAVSLGHHNASTEIINEAVDAGAFMATHLGNGCANMIDRRNNPFWSQLANDRIVITLIADGAHLTNEQLQCFYRIKGPDNTILVSDALDLAGLEPGEYIRHERVVLLTPEVIRFPAENVLAGAASPLSSCVPKMMKITSCSLSEALQMACINPAKYMRLDDRGEIYPGKRADLIMFSIENHKMMIQRTIIAGKEVHSIDI